METAEQVGEGAVSAGSAAPLGASSTPAGVNFALHAPAATTVWLVVWPGGGDGGRCDVLLDAATHRSGEVWHVELARLAPPLEWAWRVDRPGGAAGPPPAAQRLLLDPYARAIAGA